MEGQGCYARSTGCKWSILSEQIYENRHLLIKLYEDTVYVFY